jgi:hypothetical protein
MAQSARLSTKVIEKAVDQKEADAMYDYLVHNIQWEDGIKSKHGFTRCAKMLTPNENPEILAMIDKVLKQYNREYKIFGIYLNYYVDGGMWTPNHTHTGTHQLVISLGATRKLTIGKKDIPMNNGDAILFGSVVHGIPKQPEVTEGRISIATFMTPK